MNLIGATIGNYRVVSKLGEGGMGAVFLAEHPLIGKKVALKVLHEEHTANEDVVARFFTEAKAVNDIGHPNIVDIIDFGRVQTGVGHGFVYFIMEYLNGESLSSLIQRESPVPAQRSFGIGLQVADALAASHAKGIVHRDLKPDNIYLINRGGRVHTDNVKVLDFGIAKLVGDQGGSKRTRTGIVMGTPAYMSPEQCEGRGRMDHRTDIYALGIVLFEMLTGRVPFVGEGYGEILVQHLTQPCPPLSQVRQGIDPGVEAVVLRALEKKPEHRFQTMDEMIEAMRDPAAYLARAPRLQPAPAATMMGKRNTGVGAGVSQVYGEGVSVPTIEDHPDSKPARSKVPIIAGVAVAVFAVAITLFLVFRNKPSEPSAKAPEPPITKQNVNPPDPQPKPPDPQPKPPDPQPKPPDPVKIPEVKLKVESDPPGAEVICKDDGSSKGHTPVEIAMPKAEGEKEFILKLSGYQDETTSIPVDANGRVKVAMKKVKKDPHRPKPPNNHDPVKPPGFQPITD